MRRALAIAAYCAAGAVPLLLLRGVSAALTFIGVVLMALLIVQLTSSELRDARGREALLTSYRGAGAGEAAAPRRRFGALPSTGAAGLFLIGCIVWAAWKPEAAPLATTSDTVLPTPAAVDVPEARKLEAATLLANASTARQQGNFVGAFDLASQALRVWPDFEDARTFVKDATLQATTQAGTATLNQAAIDARAAARAAQARRSAYFAYANRLAPMSAAYGATLGRLNALIDQGRAAPQVMTTADWLARTEAVMGSLRLTAAQMAAIAPVPPEMAPVAVLMATLDSQTAQLSSDLIREAGSGTAPDLTAASARLEQITLTIGRARTGVEAYIPSLIPAP